MPQAAARGCEQGREETHQVSKSLNYPSLKSTVVLLRYRIFRNIMNEDIAIHGKEAATEVVDLPEYSQGQEVHATIEEIIAGANSSVLRS